jgi:hypothetical protein
VSLNPTHHDNLCDSQGIVSFGNDATQSSFPKHNETTDDTKTMKIDSKKLANEKVSSVSLYNEDKRTG